MYTEWLAMEHYRIHLMEEWPDGPRKDAGLAAAHAALEALERAAPVASAFVCDVCAKRQADKIVPYPGTAPPARPDRLAA
jgi:hypothetical protein